MNKFYIEKLILDGNNKNPSIINFEDGLNIISGPSNTGKTYILECIDYLFGKDKIHFDLNTGYNFITLILKTEYGLIALKREINTNKIQVNSNDPRIESKDYRLSGKNNINSVWLRLIGIDDEHKIIKNERYEKNRLTWRTISHIFLLKESHVIKTSSIIYPTQNTAKTCALSTLYFLITGEDFSKLNEEEDKTIKEAQKKAVAEYINKRLEDFTKRKNKLENLSNMDSFYLEGEVRKYIREIAETEGKIAESISKRKLLLKEIYTAGEQLAESNILYNRYQALNSQYLSDIRRLTFIVEGELYKDQISSNPKCPFCESEIRHSQKESSYIEASSAELHKIQIQLDDLMETEADLENEINTLEYKIEALNSVRSDVDNIINSELKPKMHMLESSLSEYRRAIEIQNESALINEFEFSLKNELVESNIKEVSEIKFKIKNYFNMDIIETINQYIDKILSSSKFDCYSSSFLNLSSFDLVVNGKAKESFGKGYRAFLNTALALALMEYLSKHGKYSPNLLIVDSPILSLKERGDEKASNTMKAHLFQYMLDNQENGQVIIVENDIPDLDYRNANLITFTKNESEGRYGFLNGIR